MDPLPVDLFDPACPHSAMPIRFGDKWTAMVIRCLEDGPRRFSELRVPMAQVTPKVLTQTLRAMERDGLLTRTAYAEVPPRVLYELTPLGRTLLAPMAAACAWAAEHLDEVVAARARAALGDGAHADRTADPRLHAGQPSDRRERSGAGR